MQTPPKPPPLAALAAQLRQAADISNVAPRGRGGHLSKLIQMFQAMQVDPSVQNLVGPHFADSLAQLTGAAPSRISGMETTDLGDYWPAANQMNVTPAEVIGSYRFKRSKPEARATMAHEFGHVYEVGHPDFYRRFVEMNPNEPADVGGPDLFSHGNALMNMLREAFADAYAQAVHHVFPQTVIEHGTGLADAYNYSKSPALITARQQSLLDSLVRSNLPQVQK